MVKKRLDLLLTALYPILLLLLLAALVFPEQRTPNCALCGNGEISYHAPSLVSLSTGHVLELSAYRQHSRYVGELAASQSAYHSTVGFYEGMTYHIHLDTHSIALDRKEMTVPADDSLFCLNCQSLIQASAAQGYVLADLYDTGNIQLYDIAVGAEYHIRDYAVTVGQAASGYQITSRCMRPEPIPANQCILTGQAPPFAALDGQDQLGVLSVNTGKLVPLNLQGAGDCINTINLNPEDTSASFARIKVYPRKRAEITVRLGRRPYAYFDDARQYLCESCTVSLTWPRGHLDVALYDFSESKLYPLPMESGTFFIRNYMVLTTAKEDAFTIIILITE